MIRILRATIIMAAVALSVGRITAQEYQEPTSRPIRVERFVNIITGAHVFRVEPANGTAGSRVSALASQPNELKQDLPQSSIEDSPFFYVYSERHTATVPISVFRMPDGAEVFAADDLESEGLRGMGAYDSGNPVYVYALPVEGASEVFRLRAASGDIVYTTSRREREQLLAQGWTATRSLGFAQSESSTGTGILLPETVKLDVSEMRSILRATENGSEIVFRSGDPVGSALRPGLIVYAERSSTMPFGLVARIVEVRTVGSEIQISTAPVALTDAFLEVHLFVDRKPFYFLPTDNSVPAGADTPVQRILDASGAGSTPAGLGALRPVDLATSISWRTWPTGADTSVTTTGSATWTTTSSSGSTIGSVKVDGSLQLGISAEFVYNAYNSCQINPTATFLITPRETAAISVTASGQMTRGGEKKIAGPFVGSFTLGGIPITGQVDVFAGYDATGTLSATVSATETARATVGVQYNTASKSLKPIVCPNPCPPGFRCGPDVTPPSPTCSVSSTYSGALSFDAAASVYVRPQLYLFVGALGTGLGPVGSAKAQVQARLEMPNINLYAQLIPAVSAKLTVANCTIAELPQYEAPPLEKKFASLAVALPAPSTISATKGTSRTSVTVSWSSVSYASGCHVYRATSATGTKTRLTASPVSTFKFDDTTGTALATYFYWVTSMNGTKEGPFGASATGYRAK